MCKQCVPKMVEIAEAAAGRVGAVQEALERRISAEEASGEPPSEFLTLHVALGSVLELQALVLDGQARLMATLVGIEQGKRPRRHH